MSNPKSYHQQLKPDETFGRPSFRNSSNNTSLRFSVPTAGYSGWKIWLSNVSASFTKCSSSYSSFTECVLLLFSYCCDTRQAGCVSLSLFSLCVITKCIHAHGSITYYVNCCVYYLYMGVDYWAVCHHHHMIIVVIVMSWLLLRLRLCLFTDVPYIYTFVYFNIAACE
jgi:hypothetical protein